MASGPSGRRNPIDRQDRNATLPGVDNPEKSSGAAMIGTKLGPYEILEKIGAGGMGEVYRARDTRLGRDVAVQVLPEGLTTDANRLRRFEQEARSAGMLNHPNIL